MTIGTYFKRYCSLKNVDPYDHCDAFLVAFDPEKASCSPPTGRRAGRGRRCGGGSPRPDPPSRPPSSSGPAS